MDLSLTEENYIKAIFFVTRGNPQGGTSTNSLSAHLNNRAASVTDMLKKLALKKIIHYEKYKSVRLTPKGVKLAMEIIRRHRLWEVFLTEKLKFRWDEVHDIAEELEHIKSPELIRRLDKFLGSPRFDPHGDPIPDAFGRLDDGGVRKLSDATENTDYVFRGVADHSSAFLQHLSSIGFAIGDAIHVSKINAFDGSIRVKHNRHSRFLSEKVASNILVVPKNE